MSHLPTLGGFTGPPVLFPAATSTHLQIGNDEQPPLTRGKITTGSDSESAATAPLSIIYQNSNLEVLCPRTGERLAAYSFRGDSDVKIRKCDEFGLIETRTTEITCVAEIGINISRPYLPPGQLFDNNCSFASSAQSNRLQNRRLLAVGLSTGHLCILDVKSSRIVRAVRVPNRITSVAVLSNGSVSWTEEDEEACGGSGNTNSRNFAEELLFFHGIIAVGTQGGHVYILDACLDMLDSEETEKNPSDLHFLPSSLQSDIQNLAALRSVLHKRSERLCIPLNVNAFKKASDLFSYFNTITDEEVLFPINGVIVSCLHYVPQMAALLIGFNFGAWQIWSTSRLVMEYGSLFDERIPSKERSFPPVVEFAFAEPENDPSNHCYVWVVSGDRDFDTLEEKSESVKKLAVTSLYSLSYSNRDDGGDLYGTLYTGLRACSLRFESDLPAEPNLEAEFKVKGSTCMACYTLGNSLNTNALSVANVSDENCQDSMLSKMGLTVFVWEVQLVEKHDSTQRSWRYYLGLFDLNGWYLAQMPSSVTLGPSRQCPFFNFCCLDEVIASESQLIFVWVDSSTLSRYYQLPGLFGVSSVQTPPSIQDQYFYPSSISFDMICLLDKSFVHANHLGLQRKVLLELQNQGRSGIVDPSDLYQLCLIAGIIESPSGNPDHDNSHSNDVPTEEKRSALLTVALEHNLINLLTGCVKHWSDGKYSSAGCTLEFLLNWSWQSVCNLKQSADVSMVPLFDNSDSVSSDSLGKVLRHKSQQMHHLSTIIKTAFEVISTMRDHPYGSLNVLDEQLKLKLHLTQLITNYLDVILWFLNSEFLPEQAEVESSLYPSAHMRQVYSKKRERMSEQLQAWEASNSMTEVNTRETSFMLIDTLCKEFGDQFKVNLEREGGDGLYPSPTLHAFLITYLIHKDGAENDTSSDLIHKHRLIQYLFLDLASCMSNDGVEEGNTTIVNSLIKFPSAFGIPPSIIKLTQAFWLVDHEDFDEAITMLLDPLVSGNHISDSQHRSIILAFLAQDKPKFALQYVQIRQPPQKDLTDIQLHIAVLLANGLVHESFQFLRRHSTAEVQSSSTHVQILLYYFFNRCDHLGKLDSILQLPLTIREEKILVDFLLNSDDQRISRKETLLIYYLQRSRYSEAVALHDKLENLSSGSATRKAIMQRYEHILPSFRQGRLGSLQSRWPGLPSTNLSQPISVLMASAQKTSGATPTFHSTRHFRMMSVDSPSAVHYSNEFTPFRPKNKRRHNETLEDQEELLPNESKRTKLDICSQIMTPSTVRLTSFINQSILSVLDTPTIKSVKKTPPARTTLNISVTPHSILKLQRGRSESPALTRFSETRRFLDELDETSEEASEDLRPSLLKAARTPATFSRESTPSKSLRFALPEPEKIFPSPLEEETEETDPEELTPAIQQEERSLLPDSLSQRSPSPERRSLSTSKIFTTGDDSDDEIDLVENDSAINEESQFQFETPDASISGKVDASYFAPSVTMPVDVTLVREIAKSDAQSCENFPPSSIMGTISSDQTMSTDTDASFFSPKSSREEINASMLVSNTTTRIDMSLIRQLAHEDSDVTLEVDDGERVDDTCVTRDQTYQCDASLYLGNRTDVVDESLVERIVETEKDSVSVSKNLAMTPKKSIPQVLGIVPLDQPVADQSVAPEDASMFESNQTAVFDHSLVRNLAKEDIAQISLDPPSAVDLPKETGNENVSPGPEVSHISKKRKRFSENVPAQSESHVDFDPVEQMMLGKEKRFRSSKTSTSASFSKEPESIPQIEQGNHPSEKNKSPAEHDKDSIPTPVNLETAKEPKSPVIKSQTSKLESTGVIEATPRRSGRRQKSPSFQEVDLAQNPETKPETKETEASVQAAEVLAIQEKVSTPKKSGAGVRTEKDETEPSSSDMNVTLTATPSRSLRSHLVQTSKLETITEVGAVETPTPRRSSRSSISNTPDVATSSTRPRRTRSSQSASSADGNKTEKSSRSRSTSFAVATSGLAKVDDSPSKTFPATVKSASKKKTDPEDDSMLTKRASPTKAKAVLDDESPATIELEHVQVQDTALLENTLTSESMAGSKTPTRSSRRSKKSFSSEVMQELEAPIAKTPTKTTKQLGEAGLNTSAVSSPVAVRTPGRGRRQALTSESTEKISPVQSQKGESSPEKEDKQVPSESTPLPATPSRSLRSQTMQVPKLETISEMGNPETPGRRSTRSAASKVVESTLTPSRRTRSSQSASSVEEAKVGRTPRSRSISSANAKPATETVQPVKESSIIERQNFPPSDPEVAQDANLQEDDQLPGPSRGRRSQKIKIEDPFPAVVTKNELDSDDDGPKGPTKKKKYLVTKVVKYRKI